VFATTADCPNKTMFLFLATVGDEFTLIRPKNSKKSLFMWTYLAGFG
jgi:hypothetical protein